MNEALQTVSVFIYTQIEFPTSLMMILVMSFRRHRRRMMVVPMRNEKEKTN